MSEFPAEPFVRHAAAMPAQIAVCGRKTGICQWEDRGTERQNGAQKNADNTQTVRKRRRPDAVSFIMPGEVARKGTSLAL